MAKGVLFAYTINSRSLTVSPAYDLGGAGGEGGMSSGSEKDLSHGAFGRLCRPKNARSREMKICKSLTI